MVVGSGAQEARGEDGDRSVDVDWGGAVDGGVGMDGDADWHDCIGHGSHGARGVDAAHSGSREGDGSGESNDGWAAGMIDDLVFDEGSGTPVNSTLPSEKLIVKPVTLFLSLPKFCWRYCM